MHCEPRDGDGPHVRETRIDYAIPGDAYMLREVVVKGAESRQVLRHEPTLPADRIPYRDAVVRRENMIEAYGGLIGSVMLVASVEVIIAVHSCSDHRRGAHHCHSAAHHSHLHVGTGNVFR